MATVPGGDRVDVLLRRLDPELPLPSYAHPGDAGADLLTAVDIDLAPGERMLVPTGIAIALPPGYAAFVHPRSGLAARFGLGVVNAPGTVDAGYRGEIKVLVINHDREHRVRLQRGHRIAQLVVQRVEHAVFHEVELLPGSARGEGGYGSTGGFADDQGQRDAATAQEDDMGLFRRNRERNSDDASGSDDAGAAGDEPTVVDTDVADADGDWHDTEDADRGDDSAEPAASPPRSRASGPWDISEMPDPAAGGRVDLGGLWIPAFDGLEIRVEGDQETGAVLSVTLVYEDSAVQVQPFAAPRSGGIWDEVRAELAASLTSQGGTADVVEGPLGPELRAKVPVRRPNGSSGVEAARFLGVDGPRWFLRGAFTGRAAAAPTADEPLLQVFQDIVVVRGTAAMAPRDPIPLVLPQEATHGQEDQVEETLSPFERGPEITEVR